LRPGQHSGVASPCYRLHILPAARRDGPVRIRQHTQMICTSKFTFLHLHKTGGQSINAALLRCIPDAREIGYHLPVKHLPRQAMDLPRLGVLRNPWDWYVSWYAFNNLRGVKNPLFSIVSRGKQAGFKETITNLVNYPEDTPDNAMMRAAHEAILPDTFADDGGSGFTKACLADFRSESLGYYSLLVKRMFGEQFAEQRLVRFESLQQELVATLKELGVQEHGAVEAILRDEPRKNRSDHDHYSRYYDDELVELIRTKEQPVIDCCQYVFQAQKAGTLPRSIEPGKRVSRLGGSGARFAKLGTAPNTQVLQKKVLELTEADWSESDRHRQFDIHRETQSIQLLMDDMSHTVPEATRFYAEFEGLLQPIFTQLHSYFGPGGTFVRVLLARLAAGAEIEPHVDKGYSLINCNRVHIPLITNDAVTFFVGGERRILAEGEIWEINNATVHAVANHSARARVHLIIDWTPTGTLLREKKAFRMDVPKLYQPQMRVRQ